jgi:hypothetical protein
VSGQAISASGHHVKADLSLVFNHSSFFFFLHPRMLPLFS